MASSYSFDVVSDVDMQEVDNAINQSVKEIATRYDFKGSKAEIKLSGEEIKLVAEDEFRLNSVMEVLKVKFVKRGISVKALDFGKVENGTLGSARQTVKIVKGISREKAKDVVSDIKNSKIRVQVQIMDVQVRVTGKDKDDLQQTIALLKSKDYGIELQFINFRS
ncbi:MAG: YajQ family cyclic di-GMP-binding protein [Clostridiaceae bacterium]|nr:YajQ family cyclic di-GMP-binding protein [Clostridiaceae bacterium]